MEINTNSFNNNKLYHKINPKKMHKSLSPDHINLNTFKKIPKANFVSLVNNLSSDIKLFYYSTKNCINQGKSPIYKSKFSSVQIFEIIEKNLNEFITKAKDIFKRMKYIQKINIIQQEMNKSTPNTDSVYLNSNLENKNSFIEDELYIANLLEKTKKKNFGKNISTSPKITNYFKIHSPDSDNDVIKSLNNSSKDMKLIDKYDYYYNMENQSNPRHGMNKIIYNYDRQYNNLKRSNNTKSVINLRKKILIDKKQDNTSMGSLGVSNSQIFNNINNKIMTSSSFIGRKDIYENINLIITLLKELKSIKGNIFIKSLEAEKHKSLLSKIDTEFIKLIKLIFKKNNNNNPVNNSSDISNDNNNIQNDSYNFTFNNLSKNNKNENINQNIKTDYFNKEKKFRDLIIQQMQLKQNKTLVKNNKNIELIKHRCIELQKEKEKIIIINNELKKKIILLENELNNVHNQPQRESLIKVYIKQNFYFQYISNGEYIGEKGQKIIDELTTGIKAKNEEIEKINTELNTYKANEIKIKEEIDKYNEAKNVLINEKKELIEENNKIKEKIIIIQKEIENANKQSDEYINENKTLKENIEKQSQNIEKYKKIITYQEEEIKNLKNNNPTYDNNINNIHNSNIKTESDTMKKSPLDNNINLDEKKNKKRNSSKLSDYQIEQDKIYLKYELLKNDYDKLNNTLQQKQKLLDNYSKISSETASKTNIDEQILDLMDKHKKEIEELTKKYNKSIIKLKMNQPSPYSPETHKILVDKRYSKYDLKWYLITMITEQEKNYENTFWVSEMEMKPLLAQFNDFKTEKEIEEEKFENLYRLQEKWIKQINENEKLIEILKGKLEEYESNSGT